MGMPSSARLRGVLPGPGVGADVVAVLTGDGDADAVSVRAVAEARRRAGRIRFWQVLPAGVEPGERERFDRVTFRAAMRAMAAHPGMPCSFELVVGGLGPELSDRVGDAGLVILAEEVAAAIEPSTLAAVADGATRQVIRVDALVGGAPAR